MRTENIMNVTLTVIILFLILLALWGWFSGFIRMVCVLFSSIIVFILTMFLSPVTTSILSKSDKVYDFFYEKVASNIELPSVDAGTALLYFDNIDIPSGIEDSLREGLVGLSRDVNTASDDAGIYIRDKITLMIIKAFSFLITYAIVAILVGIIFRLFNILSRLPIVRVANRLLGVTSGLVLGVLLVFLFMAVVSFLTPGAFGESVVHDIESSSVLGWRYNNNFIAPLVAKYLV